jgi:hypothetical protein
LWVHWQKKFDGWWHPALKHVVTSDPEQFGLEEGTKKCALAMIEVTRSWAECHCHICLQGKINKKIMHELKAKVFTREEELTYIKQCQAELGAAHEWVQGFNYGQYSNGPGLCHDVMLILLLKWSLAMPRPDDKIPKGWFDQCRLHQKPLLQFDLPECKVLDEHTVHRQPFL